MKRIFSVLLLVIALVFATSCEKENVNMTSDSQSENQFKAEEDEMHVMIPTVHGQIFMSSGQTPQNMTITFTGQDVTYFASTHPDMNGNFTFYNVVAGNYKRKTYENGNLIQTVNYVAEE